MVRLNPDGKSDTTFSNDGIVSTSVGKIEGQTLNSSISAINSITIQNDGKIIACGYCTNGENGGAIAKDFALVRYNSDGSIDSSFRAKGIIITSIGNLDDIAYSIEVKNDDKIIAGGYTDSGIDKDYALVRYNHDGSIDSTFGLNGIAVNNFGAAGNIIKSIVLQADGSIVAAGHSSNNNSTIAVGTIARYSADTKTKGKVEKIFQEVPALFNLYQNYPNPFNPSTVISWEQPSGSHVSIKIYDILGREVSTLINEEKAAGNYKVTFNAGNLASGVYFYMLKAGEFVQIRKMILIR